MSAVFKQSDLFRDERVVARWTLEGEAWRTFLHVDLIRRLTIDAGVAVISLVAGAVVAAMGMIFGGAAIGPMVFVIVAGTFWLFLVVHALWTVAMHARNRAAPGEVVIARTAIRVGARVGRWDLGGNPRLDKVERDDTLRCLRFDWSAQYGRGARSESSMFVPLPADEAPVKRVLGHFQVGGAPAAPPVVAKPRRKKR